MPVELEYKYLVDKSQVTFAEFLTELESQGICYDIQGITQGYLPKAGRLRKIVRYNDVNGIPDERFVFTYKHKLSFQPGDLEIETDISESDFYLGSKDCSFNIDKTRVTFNSGPHTWEIDFFNDKSKDDKPEHYLILIECEVQDGKRPDLNYLPSSLRSAIQYTVPLGDSRFSNKNLSFIEHVEDLYKTCK